MSIAISEKSERIVAVIYRVYGSGTGYLFGIPPELRDAVEAIVVIALGISIREEQGEEAKCRTC